MELKLTGLARLGAFPFQFESHLYGIETGLSRLRADRHVSFESHLYGIETVMLLSIK